MSRDLLRNIPAVDDLLKHDKAEDVIETFGRNAVKQNINEHLEELRNRFRSLDEQGDSGSESSSPVSPESILSAVEQRLEQTRTPSITRVVNGTGIILHTGLGRSVLDEDVLDHVRDVHRGYSLLAVDRENKERVRREHRAADMLCELTGAESATAVNNNAAAVFLILSTFAKDQEVIISRGELVEIGGSFRVPDVMGQSGAELVEVGTTNKTHPSDYRNAINKQTALLMKVHTSNYRIVGFQQGTSIDDLSSLAGEHGLLSVADLGSGALIDVSQYGAGHEPVARASIEQGADLICFSGDKLLGGPQAGFIAGDSDLVDELRNHPLFRAMRLDKLILTAMEKTLATYLQSDQMNEQLPVYRMLGRDADDLKEDAEDLAEAIEQLNGYSAEVVEGSSRVGGGSLPGQELPTHVVRILPGEMPAGQKSLNLRLHNPPVFTRVKEGAIHVDPRTLVDGDQEIILTALEE